MTGTLYIFPSPATKNAPRAGTVSLNGIERMTTDESFRAVSVATEALNRELDEALAYAKKSLERALTMRKHARARIAENKVLVTKRR